MARHRWRPRGRCSRASRTFQRAWRKRGPSARANAGGRHRGGRLGSAPDERRPRRLFDFNGTLSDDEPILCEIYRDVRRARAGRCRRRSTTTSSPAIGRGDRRRLARCTRPDSQRSIAERVRALPRGVCGRIDDRTSKRRAAVRYAAARVPARDLLRRRRAEIEPVAEPVRARDASRAIVAADDVVDGKPHPEGYLKALDAPRRRRPPASVVGFEDTEAGSWQRPRRAGIRCVAVPRHVGGASGSRDADELVDRIDVERLQRLLG